MKYTKITIAIGLLMPIIGCQSTSDETSALVEKNQVAQEDSAYAAFQRIKGEYETWLEKLQESKSLKIYSTSQYRALLKEWNDAVDIYKEVSIDPSEATKSSSLFSSTTNAEAFDNHLKMVKEKHKNLLELKTIADDLLADAIAQKQYLDKLDAKTSYVHDYNRLVSSYNALFLEVEQGDLDDAQSKQVVFLNKAKDLEQKVVLKRYVKPLKVQLDSMRKQEFNEVAAISYAKAKAEIMAAEQVIRANTRDLDVIQQAVSASQFELEHVKSVALEVKKLASVENDKFEPTVLGFENKLLTLSQAVDNSDFRDQVLRLQAENILAGIQELKSELETAKLSHTASETKLNDENRTLKQTLKDKVSALAQFEVDKQSLTKQVEQLTAHIENLETLVEVYKKQQLPSDTENGESPKAVSEAVATKQIEPKPEAVEQPQEQAPKEDASEKSTESKNG